MQIFRRRFLRDAGALAIAGTLLNVAAEGQTNPPPAKGSEPQKPPALSPEKVQSVVGKSHGDLEAVRKLVEETPLLVNAVWDWGGGDFETPLEAAAHTGGREIAQYLLSKGARPSLYAAGMLGQLDLVKAFLATDPNAHSVPGPHGFTLLHCVKRGGEPAKPVLAWLMDQGVPDVGRRDLAYVWPSKK